MAKTKVLPLIPKAGKSVDLSQYDPDFKGDYDKDTLKAETKAMQSELHDLQERLYAEGKQSLLIVLQAMDAGGKDSTIEHVMGAFNPQGVKVTPFKVPSEEEQAHDFLWRVHKATPRRGMIGIFNRSHYEDVLVVRVKDLVPKEVWQKRYDHINAFESLLADSGVTIVKFFLYISKEEQKERLLDRQQTPSKHWKFSPGDLKERERWDDYMAAFEDALTKCNTAYAPWYVIPANRKWYRNLVVSEILIHTLEKLDLRYPDPIPNIDSYTIPD